MHKGLKNTENVSFEFSCQKTIIFGQTSKNVGQETANLLLITDLLLNNWQNENSVTLCWKKIAACPRKKQLLTFSRIGFLLLLLLVFFQVSRLALSTNLGMELMASAKKTARAQCFENPSKSPILVHWKLETFWAIIKHYE